MPARSRHCDQAAFSMYLFKATVGNGKAEKSVIACKSGNLPIIGTEGHTLRSRGIDRTMSAQNEFYCHAFCIAEGIFCARPCLLKIRRN